MRILIVGAGVVGSHLAYYANRYLGSLDVAISTAHDGQEKRADLFSGSHPVYNDNVSGLENYWHQVVDLAAIKCKFLSPRYSFLNEFLGERAEFVPFRKVKVYKQIRKTIEVFPKIHTINSIGNDVAVCFVGGQIEKFDTVIITHGALPQEDVLVNSGLAKLSGTCDDHIVFRGEKIKKSENGKPHKIKRISMNGILRSYDVIQYGDLSIKKSTRLHFGGRHHSIEQGLIYSGKTKVSMITSILKRASLNMIKNATSLRYGYPRSSHYYYNFYQVPAKEIMKYEGNSVSVNHEKAKELTSIAQSLDYDGSLFSGIHFHNTYSYLSSEVANREYNGSKVILISPQFKYEPGCHHFTADLMATSEKIIRDLSQYD